MLIKRRHWKKPVEYDIYINEIDIENLKRGGFERISKHYFLRYNKSGTLKGFTNKCLWCEKPFITDNKDDEICDKCFDENKGGKRK